MLIDENNEDIDTAINSINDGKHGIVHPQILTPAMLKETIKEFKTLQRTRYHFDAEEDNYQHIIDISVLSVAAFKGLFTYVLEMLVIEKDEGTLEHIIPIPHQINDIFLSIIQNHDYVIKFRDSYIPTDKTSILECNKQISEYKICKRNQPHIKLLDSETCEATLFKRYSKTKCNSSPYLLQKETFIPMSNGYIVIPWINLELDISCDKSIKQEIISKPSTINGQNCKLYNNYDTLYLKSHIGRNFTKRINVTYNLKYFKDDLLNLKTKLIQLPKLIDNEELKQARISLDDTENLLNNNSTTRLGLKLLWNGSKT